MLADRGLEPGSELEIDAEAEAEPEPEPEMEPLPWPVPRKRGLSVVESVWRASPPSTSV